MAYTKNSLKTSTNNKPVGSSGKGVKIITKNGVAHLFSDTNTNSMEVLSELKVWDIAENLVIRWNWKISVMKQ